MVYVVPFGRIGALARALGAEHDDDVLSAWPVTTSSTAAGSANCCAAPRSLRSSITGLAEPPPPSTAGHDLTLKLRRHADNHRSLESGRHAGINILAVTVITDWRGSRPHTWPISQSTTTPPARKDQADELRFSEGLSLPTPPGEY